MLARRLSVGLWCGLCAPAGAACEALLGEWQCFTGGSVRSERDHRILGHTVAPPAGTVFHNKAEHLSYIRAGLVRIAWQEYDDCRRAALEPGEQRTCYPPASLRP